METLKIPPPDISSPMNSISAGLRSKISFNFATLRPFCASSIVLRDTYELIHGGNSKKRLSRDSCSVRVKVSEAQFKENWLESLSCPIPEKVGEWGSEQKSENGGLKWVVGVDPDVSGALAILKSDESVCSAQVFDSPYVQVLVGKKARRRLDAKSIVQLLRSFDAPLGTTAYIEQSLPFPQDGKQGWWGGGFGYGMWIGILVASGFSVVPVPSTLWKNHFQLSGSRLTKDDSRKAACTLFPSLSSLLKRKKDHGRAEALLIAAYGKGLQIKPNSCTTEMLLTSEIGVAPDSCTTEMLLTSENGVAFDSCTTEMLLTSENGGAPMEMLVENGVSSDLCTTEMLSTSETEVLSALHTTEMLLTSENGVVSDSYTMEKFLTSESVVASASYNTTDMLLTSENGVADAV